MTLSSDQSFLQRARAEIYAAQHRRAIKRRQEKLEQQTERTELELFIATAKAEGLDPENNPRDLAILVRAWALKTGATLPDDERADDWDTSGGPFVD